jgi:hypothetical protein
MLELSRMSGARAQRIAERVWVRSGLLADLLSVMEALSMSGIAPRTIATVASSTFPGQRRNARATRAGLGYDIRERGDSRRAVTRTGAGGNRVLLSRRSVAHALEWWHPLGVAAPRASNSLHIPLLHQLDKLGVTDCTEIIACCTAVSHERVRERAAERDAVSIAFQE